MNDVQRETALYIGGRRVPGGGVDVNGGAFDSGAPFGGYTQSGIGREIGEYGIADVIEVKAVR